MAATLHDQRYKRLVRALVEAREAAGLTQRELAKRLRRQPSYVGKTERLDRRLDLIELVDWVTAIGLKPSTFISQIIADAQRRS